MIRKTAEYVGRFRKPQRRKTQFAALFFSLMLGLHLFPVSCTPPASPSGGVSRQVIDSIATRRIDSLRPLMDSLCEQQTKQQMPGLIDSMLEYRLEDMKKRLKGLK